jgi:hypothetical protein
MASQNCVFELYLDRQQAVCYGNAELPTHPIVTSSIGNQAAVDSTEPTQSAFEARYPSREMVHTLYDFKFQMLPGLLQVVQAL